MEIRNFLSILKRRMWIILATMIVTIFVVVLGTFLTEPSYSATAVIRVATSAAVTPGSSDYMFADRLLNTYVEIASTNPILTDLLKKSHIDILPKIVVKSVANTELIRITVEDASPQLATDVANVLAQILVSQSGEFYAGTGKSQVEILREQVDSVKLELDQAIRDYQSILAEIPLDNNSLGIAGKIVDVKTQIYANFLQQYEQARLKESIRENVVSIVEPATLPSTPSKPNKLLNISLGVIVGLVGGLGLAFLFENLDTTLYTTDQIKDIANYNIVGRIPENKKQDRSFNEDTPFFDAFNHLSNNLLTTNQNFLQSCLITSAEPGEGKSTIVSNLAHSLSKAGKKVVIIDCDMRKPSIHTYFNIPNETGLSNILGKSDSIGDVIQESSFASIKIITSGPRPQYPVELLRSLKMRELIKSLSDEFDLVILDSPALLPVPDAGIIASYVDGVLMVTRRGRTTKVALVIACSQLTELKVRILGLIVNNDTLRFHYPYHSNTK